MLVKFMVIFLKVVRALTCDKDKNGVQTGNPSFAKLAFWLVLGKFLSNPRLFTQFWFYLLVTILAYILFGTKFLPAFFAARGLKPFGSKDEAYDGEGGKDKEDV